MDELRVTQEDRDAAADFMRQAKADGMIRRGSEKDIPLAQAFAAHRVAAIRTVLEAMETPSEAMIEAGLETGSRFGKPAMANIWGKMLAAFKQENGFKP